MYTGLNTLKSLMAHDIHCPLEDKDKDKMTERPNLLYIFENVTTQGYQNGMVGESLVMHGG